MLFCVSFFLNENFSKDGQNKLSLSTNLDSLAAVFLVTRNNSQCMNKVVSGIEIYGARVAQAVRMHQQG